jgi:hypothetical protein
VTVRHKHRSSYLQYKSSSRNEAKNKQIRISASKCFGIKEVRIVQMASVDMAGTCGTAAILQSPLCVVQTDAKKKNSGFGTEVEQMAELTELRPSAGLHWLT